MEHIFRFQNNQVLSQTTKLCLQIYYFLASCNSTLSRFSFFFTDCSFCFQLFFFYSLKIVLFSKLMYLQGRLTAIPAIEPFQSLSGLIQQKYFAHSRYYLLVSPGKWGMMRGGGWGAQADGILLPYLVSFRASSKLFKPHLNMTTNDQLENGKGSGGSCTRGFYRLGLEVAHTPSVRASQMTTSYRKEACEMQPTYIPSKKEKMIADNLTAFTTILNLQFRWFLSIPEVLLPFVPQMATSSLRMLTIDPGFQAFIILFPNIKIAFQLVSLPPSSQNYSFLIHSLYHFLNYIFQIVILKSFQGCAQSESPKFLGWHKNFSKIVLIPLHLPSSLTLFDSHPPLSHTEPPLWSTKLAWPLCCSFHRECSF